MYVDEADTHLPRLQNSTMPILDFSEGADERYSLKCVNRSTQSWYFYLFQRQQNPSGTDKFSLCWMVSPYRIGVGSFMTFRWSMEYGFSWLNTGRLEAGSTPLSGGYVLGSLTTANSTTFDIVENTPELATPSPGDPADLFLIHGGEDLPNRIFSTGIGMSGSAAIVMQTYANTPQQFSANTSYWVGATTRQIRHNEVLQQDVIPNSSEFHFPANTYSMTLKLGEDNQWSKT